MAESLWLFLILYPFLVEECVEDTGHQWKLYWKGARKVKTLPQCATAEAPSSIASDAHRQTQLEASGQGSL